MARYAERVVFVVAIAAGLITYLGLHERPWGMDAALCVGYTVLVFGLGYADEDSRLFSSEPARPILQVSLVHLCFLAAVVGVVRLFSYLRPNFPTWLREEGSRSSWSLLIEIGALVALGYWEKWLLFRDPDSSEDSSGA